jgi:hypothetical protein
MCVYGLPSKFLIAIVTKKSQTLYLSTLLGAVKKMPTRMVLNWISVAGDVGGNPWVVADRG